jgi:hypothetical protein
MERVPKTAPETPFSAIFSYRHTLYLRFTPVLLQVHFRLPLDCFELRLAELDKLFLSRGITLRVWQLLFEVLFQFALMFRMPPPRVRRGAARAVTAAGFHDSIISPYCLKCLSAHGISLSPIHLCRHIMTPRATAYSTSGLA